LAKGEGKGKEEEAEIRERAVLLDLVVFPLF
jgi:hypothetical protein